MCPCTWTVVGSVAGGVALGIVLTVAVGLGLICYALRAIDETDAE